MSFAEDDERLIFMPFEKLNEVPRGSTWSYADSYWIVHPEKGLAFWSRDGKKRTFARAAAQCNRDKRVTEYMASKNYAPWAEVRHFPSVVVPHDPNY